MALKGKESQNGEPNIDLAETAGSALSDESVAPNAKSSSSSSSNKLIIEREQSFEEEEEESTGKVESWGVYIPTPEKTLIGLFWDKEIAQFFKDSIQDSPILDNLKKIAAK